MRLRLLLGRDRYGGCMRRGRRGVRRDIGFGSHKEDEFSGLRLGSGIAAQIAGGHAIGLNLGNGVVGVKLAARTAVGVHVREDADDGRMARVYVDDAVLVRLHGDGSNLIDSQGYVEALVGDGMVGLCVDDFDPDGVRRSLGKGRCQCEQKQERNG